MSDRQGEMLWGLLAVIGAAVPLSRFIPWLAENGLDLSLFFDELFVNQISSFFAWDVIISAVVLVLYLILDGSGISPSRRAIAAAGTLTVGVSFGLPLFFLLRTRERRIKPSG